MRGGFLSLRCLSSSSSSSSLLLSEQVKGHSENINHQILQLAQLQTNIFSNRNVGILFGMDSVSIRSLFGIYNNIITETHSAFFTQAIAISFTPALSSVVSSSSGSVPAFIKNMCGSDRVVLQHVKLSPNINIKLPSDPRTSSFTAQLEYVHVYSLSSAFLIHRYLQYDHTDLMTTSFVYQLYSEIIRRSVYRRNMVFWKRPYVQKKIFAS